MSDEALLDIRDPQVAERLGAELAGDLLRSVGDALMSVPFEARVAFFAAYVAVLTGGMKSALGDECTQAAFELHRRALLAPKSESKPVLH